MSDNNQSSQTMPEPEHWQKIHVLMAVMEFRPLTDVERKEMHEALVSIRESALSQTAWVTEGWALVHRQTLEIVGTELANARDKVKPGERAWLADLNRVVRGLLAAAPATSGGEVWTRERIADVHKRGEELFQRINPPSAASVSERARELLAAEYDKIGLNGAATYIRSGEHGELDKAIIRALEQALTQQRSKP